MTENITELFDLAKGIESIFDFELFQQASDIEHILSFLYEKTQVQICHYPTGPNQMKIMCRRLIFIFQLTMMAFRTYCIQLILYCFPKKINILKYLKIFYLKPHVHIMVVLPVLFRLLSTTIAHYKSLPLNLLKLLKLLISHHRNLAIILVCSSLFF